ncbi:MAG: hypothetical protein RLZZ179_1442 [Verrucomicrobiota bacterium]|jgi:hypothetical protein
MGMPFYEFYCPQNHRIYTFYARSMALSGKTPRCPDNPKWKMEKVPSGFSVTGRHRGDGEAEAAAENDPFAGIPEERLESVMKEFESELLSGPDDAEPDSRMMGRLMRRLSDVAGRELVGPMREMVDRLEKGEDPDALEEQYGAVLDSEEGEALFAQARQMASAQRRPTRQPGVYEMEDWLPPGRKAVVRKVPGRSRS